MIYVLQCLAFQDLDLRINKMETWSNVVLLTKVMLTIFSFNFDFWAMTWDSLQWTAMVVYLLSLSLFVGWSRRDDLMRVVNDVDDEGDAWFGWWATSSIIATIFIFFLINYNIIMMIVVWLFFKSWNNATTLFTSIFVYRLYQTHFKSYF